MITIKTKKVVFDGKKYREILHISALTREQLPEKYVEAPMHCYQLGNGLFIDIGSSTFLLTPGMFPIEEDVYQQCLEYIRQCGRRLRKINLHYWHGEETEVI